MNSSPNVVRDEMWADLVAAHGAEIDTPSMKQQWDCHVYGNVAERGTFDLEAARSSNPGWPHLILPSIAMGEGWRACNW